MSRGINESVGDLKTKGAGVSSYIEVLKEKLTPQQFEQLKGAVAPSAKALLERRILAVEWIPLSEQVSINDVLFEQVLHRDEAKFLALTRESSRRDLQGIYKVLIRVMSPDYVASQAAKIYKTYVDGGEMWVSGRNQIGKRKQFTVNVKDYGPYPTAWLAMRAYIESPLMLTGAKNLNVRLAKSEITGATAQLEYEVQYDA